MKNLIMITLVCMVSGCFLMERPYESAGRISLSPVASYKPFASNVSFQQDVKSVTQITDRIAVKYEFIDYTDLSSDIFIKYYERNRKNGGGIIQVYYIPEDDVIHISVLSTRGQLNPELVKIAIELQKIFQTEFGKDRVRENGKL